MTAELDAVRLDFGPGSVGVLTASLAFVMFGVALNLRPSDFARVWRRPRIALAGLAAQFLLLPALTVGLIHLTRPAPSLALGLLLVSCCPGGNLSNFLSLLARGNVALSVSLTAVSSSLALFLTPLNFHAWGRALPGESAALLQRVAVDPWQLVPTLLVMLVLPLAAGMVLARRLPETALRLERHARRASLLVFFGFVAAALAANGALFRTWLPVVFGLVLAHNALALGTGYASAWLAGGERADRRSLAIETGIQNSGLGLVLIFAHFDGLGGMALVAAWWGVWHIVSGLALAGWWGRLRAAVA